MRFVDETFRPAINPNSNLLNDQEEAPFYINPDDLPFIHHLRSDAGDSSKKSDFFGGPQRSERPC